MSQNNNLLMPNAATPDDAPSRHSHTTIVHQLYLDVLKKSLTGLLIDEAKMYVPVEPAFRQHLQSSWIYRPLVRHLEKTGKQITEPAKFVSEDRLQGRDWPPFALTMIGMKRLDNLQHCIEDVLSNNVAGDFIETGVWRGGAVIFMRAILRAYGINDRSVWVADSFAGLPPPDADSYPADKGDIHHTFDFLRISLEEVKENFARYGLLDEKVKFLKGWFRDTLPQAPIEKLSVLRLDGDLYESTMEALTNLYPKLQPGGYVIVDDYVLKPCREAVTDFRAMKDINEPILDIDNTGVFWQRRDA